MTYNPKSIFIALRVPALKHNISQNSFFLRCIRYADSRARKRVSCNPSAHCPYENALNTRNGLVTVKVL